jgi:hypothetical protein
MNQCNFLPTDIQNIIYEYTGKPIKWNKYSNNNIINIIKIFREKYMEEHQKNRINFIDLKNGLYSTEILLLLETNHKIKNIHIFESLFNHVYN